MGCTGKFLEQLNKLWRKRFVQQKQAIKHKYIAQIRELKRRVRTWQAGVDSRVASCSLHHAHLRLPYLYPCS